MPDKQINVVVLAAGQSARFGACKLLEDYRGEPLVRHVVRAARDAAPGGIHVVTGYQADAIAAAAAADVVVRNHDYADGMGGSIARGVRAARNGADAIIVMLADQPLVGASHLDALIERWSGDESEVVATRTSRSLGPPVLFGSAAFDALCCLDGDGGAKPVMLDPRFTLREVACDDAAIDIDTRADLEALQAR